MKNVCQIGPYKIDEDIKRNKGAVLKPIIGLYNARIGDILSVGIEGHREKVFIKVSKITKDDNIVDSSGNIFGRDGRIYRRKSHLFMNMKGKIIYAKHTTQREVDNYFRKRKIHYLNTINWDKFTDEQIDNVIKSLPNKITFTTLQGSIML
jgi:hypothetical protein